MARARVSITFFLYGIFSYFSRILDSLSPVICETKNLYNDLSRTMSKNVEVSRIIGIY